MFSIKIGKLQMNYKLDLKSSPISINENLSSLKVDVGLPINGNLIQINY